MIHFRYTNLVIVVRAYSMIKAIVIDHGSSFEVLSRYELLKTDSINKLKCRGECIKRP